MVQIVVEGIDETRQIALALRGKQARVGAQGAQVVRRSAHEVETLGKLFCPVDTGNLRNSIGSELSGDGRFGALEALIIAQASYSVYVEEGTSRMAPQAFLGPALDVAGPGFAAAVAAIGDPFD